MLKIKQFFILSFFCLPTLFYGKPSKVRITAEVNAVAKVLSSVVNIGTEQIVSVRDPYNDFFNSFFGHRRRYYKTSSLGSGVIIYKSGLILTNQHVIRRATKITVTLHNGNAYNAEIMAESAENDLALLKITGIAKNKIFPQINFALPNDLLLAETVISVGNPFGLGHTITSGIISATKRKIIDQGKVLFDDIIQTDAAINPGNSGGPLINLDGDLIGINLAIRPDSEGIGFAIPLSRIEKIVSQWLMPFRYSNSTCGIIFQTIFKDNTAYVNIKQILSDSPASKANLEPGMIITKINNHSVRQAIDASRILWQSKDSTTLTLTLNSNKKVKINLKKLSYNDITRIKLGIELQELNSQLNKAIGIPDDFPGMIITEFYDSSPLKEYLSRGDILIKINDTMLRSLKTTASLLKGKIVDPKSIQIMVLKKEYLRGKIFFRKISFNVKL